MRFMLYGKEAKREENLLAGQAAALGGLAYEE